MPLTDTVRTEDTVSVHHGINKVWAGGKHRNVNPGAMQCPFSLWAELLSKKTLWPHMAMVEVLTLSNP